MQSTRMFLSLKEMRKKLNSHDEVIPSGKWEFDDKVTEAFDNMLERSIPGFFDMRKLTTNLACHFAIEGTAIIDLGCSRGGSLAPIIEKLGNKCNYLGLEISEPMRKAAMERFANQSNLDLRILGTDLREEFPQERSSVILSILTLQFIPIEYRQQILTEAFHSLNNGGVFILVEKVLGRNSFLNDSFVNLYYNMKGENGYTEEQINTKRRALEGVLVPVTSDWNEQLLLNAGFKHVESFWRSLNFAGWIGVKSA